MHQLKRFTVYRTNKYNKQVWKKENESKVQIKYVRDDDTEKKKHDFCSLKKMGKVLLHNLQSWFFC